MDTSSHLVTECRPARQGRRETQPSLGAFLVYCIAGLAVLTFIVAVILFVSVSGRSDSPVQTGQLLSAPAALATRIG